MSSLPISTPKTPEKAFELLVGHQVRDIDLQTGKSDLSDWVELMEAVETLCPVWPDITLHIGTDYRI